MHQRLETSFLSVAAMILPGKEISTLIDVVSASLIRNGPVNLLHYIIFKRLAFKQVSQARQLAKNITLGAEIVIFQPDCINIPPHGDLTSEVRKNTLSRIHNPLVDIILAPPELVYSVLIFPVFPIHSPSGYGFGARNDRLPSNVHVRPQDSLNRVEVDRAVEESVEIRIFAGDNRNNLFDIHSVAMERPEDLLAERNPAANDVRCRLMMLDVESFLEDGLQ